MHKNLRTTYWQLIESLGNHPDKIMNTAFKGPKNCQNDPQHCDQHSLRKFGATQDTEATIW